jgi:5-methylcytosine-specific restriction protein A
MVLAEEPLCALCEAEGRVEPSSMVDHIAPKVQGGTDDRENLRGICRRHHDSKSGREGRASR